MMVYERLEVCVVCVDLRTALNTPATTLGRHTVDPNFVITRIETSSMYACVYVWNNKTQHTKMT